MSISSHQQGLSGHRLLLVLVAALAMTLLPVLAGASSDIQLSQGTDSWPVYRGPVAGGPDPGDVLPDGEFGLVESWKIALGSGYSNVSIADGKAVTMFTSGDVDVLAAFDLADGSELWRYELGEKYAGHDGSDDGPLGTPTLFDGGVYALGPKGQLVSLSLDDGAERWTHTLDESNSTVPFYGYTSAPVVTDDLVIVATGGEGHGITAFDRGDGSQAWTRGNDSVTYQTPLVTELGGRHQLVAVTDRYVQGLDPESGEILWTHLHTEGEQSTEGSAHPTPVDDETFLVKYQRSAKLYRLAGDGIEEVWETRAFANTFALPVYHDGHFYGFTGRFLTCADAETGDIVWRSRPPGGQGLSLVNGHLVVTNPDGDLVIAEASPAGYQEVARVATLESGDYPIPSYAAGHFFVRNLSEMAAVRIDREAAPQVAETAEVDRHHGEFGDWVSGVEASPEGERQDAVDAYFADVETTPILEGELVHFVYRGEAEDVGVSGFQPGNQEDGLFQVAGTDLFYRSYELDPKGQYAYVFTVDFGPPSADPSNPRTVNAGFATLSDLLMPEAPSADHVAEPADDAPRGDLDGFPFRSEILDNTREIQVYRPAGYGAGDATYPVLVVTHGDNVLRGGLMQNTLDNLVGQTVEPLIAVFVPRASGAEYGGEQADDFNRFLAEELLPHLDRHYRTDPARRAIAGPASGGVAALYAAFSMPETFPMAAAQSYYEIEPADARLEEMIAAGGSLPSQVVVAWSHNDYDIPNGPNAAEATREILDALEALDGSGIEVEEIEAHYSPGWGGWRLQDDDILEALFPAPTGDGEG